ncbi:hypothetical protein JYQ62_16905 [Nostoc sp. UHCC 0702]|nr:hypothetical protein JYQ62_16905 [Nostoc sp. UHCC 0702]
MGEAVRWGATPVVRQLLYLGEESLPLMLMLMQSAQGLRCATALPPAFCSLQLTLNVVK